MQKNSCQREKEREYLMDYHPVFYPLMICFCPRGIYMPQLV